MNLIAHRGIWNKYIKDNSYEAIKNAIKSDKYIGVEFDVRTTKDKKIIIYHDALYNGTLVSKMFYKDMKDVYLLTDILNINTNKILLIEIKDRNIDKTKLLKILNRHKRNYYIMSFNTKLIEELKVLNNKYKYGVLNYVLNSDSKYNLDFICLLDIVATDKIIKTLEKRGIEVIIYGTININKSVKYIVDDKNL